MQTITRKDLLWVAGLTLLSAILIFVGLGSRQAPQSALRLGAMEENGDEIVLDLGEDVFVSELYIYLGHMDTRTLAISVLDEEKQEWQVLDEAMEAESVYNWNAFPVGQSLRYLGIVSRNNNAVYNEMVLLDQEGNRIVPINAQEYEALFDEQELFPEDITYYYRTMFDEVYYARSAYELLNDIQMFEYTHPPLGKIFMAVGLKLFGVTPFGWRLVCAVMGILMTPLIYLFVHRLTGQTRAAVLATALLNLDFMHFTLSRIATIDSIVAFFILAMFTAMYYYLTEISGKLRNGQFYTTGKEVCYLLFGAVAAGAGVATKWTGFYAVAGIAVLFLTFWACELFMFRKEKAAARYLWCMFLRTGLGYLLVVLVIYLLSYIPMSSVAGVDVLTAAWGNGRMMLNFHKDIVFDHPYSSAWYTWPLDLVPLIDAATVIATGEKVSMVATMGNPVIWWTGLLAVLFLLWRVAFRKDKKATYLLVAYVAMLLPWVFIKRTVFIYQYYACAILLSVILGYTLSFLEKKWKKAGNVLLEAAFICGIIFYPIISGQAIEAGSVALFMEWLPRWNFLG